MHFQPYAHPFLTLRHAGASSCPAESLALVRRGGNERDSATSKFSPCVCYASSSWDREAYMVLFKLRLQAQRVQQSIHGSGRTKPFVGQWISIRRGMAKTLSNPVRSRRRARRMDGLSRAQTTREMMQKLRQAVEQVSIVDYHKCRGYQRIISPSLSTRAT